MRRISDDDDDDGFVTIGNPLPLYDEHEVPTRKPVSLEEQMVRDAQGRRRFHGAFTGGFSAGYFNTVDTKEGWQPKSFKSSRSEKAEKVASAFSQRPEDFMDEEDFGEFGIAPKKIATTKNYSEPKTNNKRKPDPSDSSVFGSTILSDLVVPCRSSVGIRLLRKLGWRDGQGIGPRVDRKHRHSRGNKSLDSTEEIPETMEVTGSVYGCALPPGFSRTTGEKSDGGSSESSEGEVPNEITFAPKDVCPINFVSKDNVHGLGYRGIDPTAALFRGSSMQQIPVTSKKSNLGIRGQAFGVGAFEEEDDDIYGVESMSNYDISIGMDDDHKAQKSNFGWTAPKDRKGKVSYEQMMQTKDSIEGFGRSTTAVLPKKIYPPPQLPRDFRPFHKFETGSDLITAQTTSKEPEKTKLTAFSRGILLGEKPHMKSVFELVSSEDRAKMEAAKMQSELQVKQQRQQQQQQQPISSSMPTESSSSRTPTSVESRSVGLTSSGSKPTGAFVPFARDPPKQRRYEAYVDAVKHGRTYVHDETSQGLHMTEWEKEREREEFAKAAHLFQPLSNMIASRFTRAKHDDDEQDVRLASEEEKSSQTKAAEMKMFGKLTRERCAWHPEKLVCRRFNIADPYPESNVVGLRTTKRDKVSIFNFLTFNEAPAETEEKKKSDDEPKTEMLSKPMKPLAILATVDLRPKPSTVQNTSDTLEKPQENVINLPSETSVASQSVAEENAEDERPPIDLFKAIFEDSDSDDEPPESVVRSDAGKESVVNETMAAEEKPRQETLMDIEMTPYDHGSKESDDQNHATVISAEKSPENLVSQDHADSSVLCSAVPVSFETFGPALPPIAQNSTEFKETIDVKTADRQVADRDSKHRHKSKHKKQKKHKSSDKKHKHKKKRKKNVKEDSSGSDADDDSASDVDQKLLSRLKGLVEKELSGGKYKS